MFTNLSTSVIAHFSFAEMQRIDSIDPSISQMWPIQIRQQGYCTGQPQAAHKTSGFSVLEGGLRNPVKYQGWSTPPMLGDRSRESASHATTGMVLVSRNWVQIFPTWVRAWSHCNVTWWWWRSGTTMGLGLICIQNAINIMHLCSPKPTPVMGRSVHKDDTGKLFTHPCTLSAIFTVQRKPG